MNITSNWAHSSLDKLYDLASETNSSISYQLFSDVLDYIERLEENESALERVLNNERN